MCPNKTSFTDRGGGLDWPMCSSLPTAGLINIWINKLLVTKKQLRNFEKEQEIILILSKGSFTDNWGLIKENNKGERWSYRNLKLKTCWDIFCLLQDGLPKPVITRNWADPQPLKVDANPFLEIEKLYPLQD